MGTQRVVVAASLAVLAVAITVVATRPRAQTHDQGWSLLPEAPLTPRSNHAAVWTGTEMLIWGGEDPSAPPPFSDGALYDPEARTWRAMAPSPLQPRVNGAAVWTGTALLVWGGESDRGRIRFDDGATYDPVTDAWTPIRPAPLRQRSRFSFAWTGSELLVWGGLAGVPGRVADDGAAYDPSKRRWRLIAQAPLSPRRSPATVWTEHELIVLGGEVDRGPNPSNGAAYDPETDRWRRIAPSPLLGRHGAVTAWTGTEAIVAGGLRWPRRDHGRYAPVMTDAAAYDPAADRWRRLPPAAPRRDGAAAWTGTHLIVWGGRDRYARKALDDGILLEPSSRRWQTLSATSLAARAQASLVWTGKELIVWGGVAAGGRTSRRYGDGATFTSLPSPAHL